MAFSSSARPLGPRVTPLFRDVQQCRSHALEISIPVDAAITVKFIGHPASNADRLTLQGQCLSRRRHQEVQAWVKRSPQVSPSNSIGVDPSWRIGSVAR